MHVNMVKFYLYIFNIIEKYAIGQL